MSLNCSAPRGAVPTQAIHRWDRGLRSLTLAILLALGSIPTTAWAKAPGTSSSYVSPKRPASRDTQAPAMADARTAQRQEYASREASAANQAKFAGGDTVVWIGGSTAVIVLLVVLIVVLV